MRVLLGIAAALMASSASAQSLDTLEEAWSIAAHHGITPDRWSLQSMTTDYAAFVEAAPIYTAGQIRRGWVFSLQTSDVTSNMMLLEFNCATRTVSQVEAIYTQWGGTGGLQSGAGAPMNAPPGSHLEFVMGHYCG